MSPRISRTSNWAHHVDMKTPAGDHPASDWYSSPTTISCRPGSGAHYLDPCRSRPDASRLHTGARRSGRLGGLGAQRRRTCSFLDGFFTHRSFPKNLRCRRLERGLYATCPISRTSTPTRITQARARTSPRLGPGGSENVWALETRRAFADTTAGQFHGRQSGFQGRGSGGLWVSPQTRQGAQW